MFARRLTMTTVAALLAIGGATALAGGYGDPVNIDTAVKIRDSAPAFHGKVVADNENCVEDRLVKLFKERRSGGKKLLGKTHAADSGKWKVIVEPLKSGAYFAVAKKVEQGTAGTIYVCARAKSKTLVVD